jgi:hypothetical protein
VQLLRPTLAFALLLACSKQERAHTEDSANKITLGPTDASVARTDDPIDASVPVTKEAPVDASPWTRPNLAAGACPKAPPGDISNARRAGACKTDADCKEQREGRCKLVYLGHGQDAPSCTYDECAVDGDCASPQLCFCGGSYTGRNVCLPGNCHVDADCKGQTCGEVPSTTNGGYIPNGHFCHTPRDQCKDAASCGQGKTCGFITERARWECVPVVYPPPG